MVKVAILGAAGGIGQPLSLLVKLNPIVTSISLYDIVRCHGVAADISHINTNSSVTGHQGKEELETCLTGAQVVVITSSVPIKPGMTREDLFGANAHIIRDLIQAIADFCPKAHICIISNPVNSTIPIAAEVLKKNSVYDPKRLYGVSTLDLVRTSRFIRDIRPDFDATTDIPVIGGHSSNTIVPILSHLGLELSQDEIAGLTNRIRFAGYEVVNAKDGNGSATLSMAYAGYRLANAIITAINGTPTNEYSYIDLSSDPQGATFYRDLGATSLDFFSAPITITKDGVQTIHPLDFPISDYERTLIKTACIEIDENIATGVDFMNK
jgi:malate dehydrogenase